MVWSERLSLQHRHRKVVTTSVNIGSRHLQKIFDEKLSTTVFLDRSFWKAPNDWWTSRLAPLRTNLKFSGRFEMSKQSLVDEETLKIQRCNRLSPILCYVPSVLDLYQCFFGLCCLGRIKLELSRRILSLVPYYWVRLFAGVLFQPCSWAAISSQPAPPSPIPTSHRIGYWVLLDGEMWPINYQCLYQIALIASITSHVAFFLPWTLKVSGSNFLEYFFHEKFSWLTPMEVRMS